MRKYNVTRDDLVAAAQLAQCCEAMLNDALLRIGASDAMPGVQKCLLAAIANAEQASRDLTHHLRVRMYDALEPDQ